MRTAPPHLRAILVGLVVLATSLTIAAAAAHAQGGVIVAGTLGTPETDLTPDQQQHLLGEYWPIARGYLTGDSAKAVKDLSAWTRDRILKVQQIQYQPEVALPTGLESKAEWQPRFLRGAAMLHTEIALAAFRARDGAQFEFHTGIADGWLALADDRKSAAGSLRSRWNVAIARLLLANAETGLAERYLERINERIPGDPAILLVFGTVKETQATRQNLPWANGKPEDPALITSARDSALNAAATLLQRAAGADASLVEARLRLARIHTLKQEDAKAEPLLTAILASQPAAPIKYLASVLLGGIRERQKQFDPAARLYVEAILAVPDGQSAYLALSQIMHAANHRDDAAAVLDKMFARRASQLTADPWWIYPLGLDTALEARFGQLRDEIRK
jgi:tetratricopeptide (TPR) repeat protein